MNTPPQKPAPNAPSPTPPRRPAPASMLRPQPRPRPQLNYFKAGAILLVGFYGVLCALNPRAYRFLDSVDLVFHEAGHPIFGLFGGFIGALGGSLMQVLIPAIVTGYFLLYNQRWSGMVTLFWVGQSLFNVSVYVKDARARALDLLGGEDVTHDWNYLLGRLNLVPYDQVVGGLVYLAGLGAIVASILGGLYYSLEEPSADD